MRIVIGADLVPTESNYELFQKGNTTELLGKELKTFLQESDYRIFNLEVPLTDDFSPIEKCGPNLSAPCNTIAGIKAIGTDLVAIANNHILDQGEQGLASTLETLKENEISYVGAGASIHEASKPYVFTFSDKKIGVYACAEYEFTIATDLTGGANPFDPLESLDHIKELKSKCDYVIVLYHGGKEHYRYPSPLLQKTCRKMVEKGADLIICQHSHCIGCMEEYKESTIIYGQGNFLFDHNKSEFWETSLLVVIEDDFRISYIPLKKVNEKVRMATQNEGAQIIHSFNERSNQICKEDFIQNEYRKFSQIYKEHYLLTLAGKNRNILFRILNKITLRQLGKLYIKFKYRKEKLLFIENCIMCEAHRELLMRGLKE